MTEPQVAAPPAGPEPTMPTDPATVAALAEVAAARAALDDELIRLEATARAAVDIRAKVKRNPGRAAAVVGGTAFVAVGGPRRVLRGVKHRVFGRPDPLPPSLLPDKVERAVSALGDDGAKVRGALEREFAAYCEAGFCVGVGNGLDALHLFAYLHTPAAHNAFFEVALDEGVYELDAKVDLVVPDGARKAVESRADLGRLLAKNPDARAVAAHRHPRGF